MWSLSFFPHRACVCVKVSVSDLVASARSARLGETARATAWVVLSRVCALARSVSLADDAETARSSVWVVLSRVRARARSAPRRDRARTCLGLLKCSFAREESKPMGVCHHHLLQFFTAYGLKGCRYRSRMKDWKVTLRTHLSPHRLYSAMLVNITELRSLPNFLATLHARVFSVRHR